MTIIERTRADRLIVAMRVRFTELARLGLIYRFLKGMSIGNLAEIMQDKLCNLSKLAMVFQHAQGLAEVGDQVIGILDAQCQPHQIIANAQF